MFKARLTKFVSKPVLGCLIKQEQNSLAPEYDPKNLNIRFELGKVYYNTHQWKKALEQFQYVYSYDFLNEDPSIPTSLLISGVTVDINPEIILRKMG